MRQKNEVLSGEVADLQEELNRLHSVENAQEMINRIARTAEALPSSLDDDELSVAFQLPHVIRDVLGGSPAEFRDEHERMLVDGARRLEDPATATRGVAEVTSMLDRLGRIDARMATLSQLVGLLEDASRLRRDWASRTDELGRIAGSSLAEVEADIQPTIAEAESAWRDLQADLRNLRPGALERGVASSADPGSSASPTRSPPIIEKAERCAGAYRELSESPAYRASLSAIPDIRHIAGVSEEGRRVADELRGEVRRTRGASWPLAYRIASNVRRSVDRADERLAEAARALQTKRGVLLSEAERAELRTEAEESRRTLEGIEAGLARYSELASQFESRVTDWESRGAFLKEQFPNAWRISADAGRESLEQIVAACRERVGGAIDAGLDEIAAAYQESLRELDNAAKERERRLEELEGGLALDDTGRSNLHRAATRCDPQRVREILDTLGESAASAVNARDTEGFTPLMLVVRSDGGTQQRSETLRLLLEHEADPGLVHDEGDGLSALHMAARAGDAASIRTILEHGKGVVRVDAHTTKTRRSALVIAAAAGHEECVRALLEGERDRRADPAQRTPDRFTAMHLAAAAGHLPVVRVLGTLAPELLEMPWGDVSPSEIARRSNEPEVADWIEAQLR